VNLSRPTDAILTSVDAGVLRVCAGTTAPLTGREIARITGHSHTRVRAILNRMADEGLLDVVVAGRSYLYTLNRDHVAAPVAVALLDLRGELVSRIRDHIEAWEVEPVSAVLFGSAARGDGGVDSDIDVLIVRPDDVAQDDEPWADDVADLRDRIERWSGNDAAIIEVSRTEFSAMVRRSAPVVDELRNDGIRLSKRSLASSGLLSHSTAVAR
jgi:predicted nucleotidyltransferase